MGKMTDCQEIKEGVFELKEGEKLSNFGVPFKGIYLFKKKDLFFYSVCLKDIIQKFQIEYSINKDFVTHILTGYYMPNFQSVINEISYIPGVYSIVLKNNQVHYSYNTNTRQGKIDSNFNSYTKKLEKAYLESIDETFSSNGTNYLSLSSGLDSSSILFGALSMEKKFKTITSKPMHSPSSRKFLYDESKRVVALANSLNFKEYNIHVRKNEDILKGIQVFATNYIEPSPSSAYNAYNLEFFKTLKKETKPKLITGSCGNLTISFDKGTPTLKLLKKIVKKIIKLEDDLIKDKIHRKKIELNYLISILPNIFCKTPYKLKILTLLGLGKTYRLNNIEDIARTLKVEYYDPTFSKNILYIIINSSHKLFNYKGTKRSFIKFFISKYNTSDFLFQEDKIGRGDNYSLESFIKQKKEFKLELLRLIKLSEIKELINLPTMVKTLNSSDTTIKQMLQICSLLQVLYIEEQLSKKLEKESLGQSLEGQRQKLE